MAKQSIDLGTTPNDGTGSNLRAGGDIINDNFDEIYTTLGSGSILSFDLTGVTNGQTLIYNSVSSKFEAGDASSTFTLSGDGGSNQTISSGDTLTVTGGTGIATTASATDTISIAIDSTVATLTDSQVLQNKTIDSANNTLTLDLSEGTLTGTTAEFNTALSDGSFATLAGNEILTNKTLTSPVINTGVSGTAILDEDNMVSDSDTKLATQQSIKAYVDANAGGGISWQTGVVADGSTVTSASAGEGYFIDTTSFAHTLQLPSSPTIGDEISIIDVAGTFDTNNLTVDRNGKPIQGSASNLTVSVERAGFTLVFYDNTQGWVLKDK